MVNKHAEALEQLQLGRKVLMGENNDTLILNLWTEFSLNSDNGYKRFLNEPIKNG